MDIKSFIQTNLLDSLNRIVARKTTKEWVSSHKWEDEWYCITNITSFLPDKEYFVL
jgi:hypothetical protein